MLSRVVKGLNALFIGQLISRVGSFLLVPLFLTYWSAARYGEWLAMFALVAYLSVLDIGMQMAAVNRLTRDFARQDWADYRMCQHSALALYSAVALAGTILVLIGTHVLPVVRMLGLRETSATTATWVLGILCFYTLWSMPGDVIVSAYQTAGNFARSQWVNNIQRVLSVALFASLLVMHIGMLGLAFAQVAIFLTTTLFVIADLRINYPNLTPGLVSARFSVIRELLHPSAMFAVIAFGMLLFYQAPLLVVSALLGGIAVATLSVTRSMTMLLRQLVDALSIALYPEFASMEGRNELTKAREAHRILLAASGALAIGLGSWFWYEGPPLITVWTRGRLKPDPLLLRLFLVYVIFQVPWVASSAYQSATNQNGTLAKCMLTSSTIGLTLSVIFLKKFGLISIPVGFTVGELLACYHFVIRRTCDLLREPYIQFAMRVWLSMVLISLLCLGIGYLAQQATLDLSLLLRMGLVGIATVSAAAVNVWLVWLGSEQRRTLVFRLRLLVRPNSVPATS